MRMPCAGCLLLTLTLAVPAAREAAAQCQIQQVTHYGGGDGIEVGFHTDVGGNRAAYSGHLRPFGGQWWGAILFDRTAAADDALQVVTRDEFFGLTSEPALDTSGNLVAFSSQSDLVPGANPEGNQEVFVFDVRTGVYVQETATVSGFKQGMDLSGDGSRLVFRSSDVTPGPSQLVVLDRTTRALTPIPGTGDDGQRPKLDGDGSRVVFLARGDLVPGENPGLVWQVFLFDLPTGSLRQLSHNTVLLSMDYSIDLAGERVVFASRESVAGGNPDGGSEVYLYEVASGQVTQITHTAVPGGSTDPAISGDGRRIVFSSFGDPAGGAGGVAGLYLHDLGSGVFQPLGDDGFRISVNHDGTFLAYVGSDPSTEPDASTEIFVAACNGLVTEVPVLGLPGFAALALLLAAAGLLALRRLA